VFIDRPSGDGKDILLELVQFQSDYYLLLVTVAVIERRLPKGKEYLLLSG